MYIQNIRPSKTDVLNIWEFFLLTGLIWGRTVFCIDIGNITLTHMVKLHLPHMYMIFNDNFKENSNPHLFYNTPELFNTFGIIRDPLKPFASNSLGPFQLLQRLFLLFFLLLTAAHLDSSVPSHESYIQRPHHSCSTANTGCKAQPKIFGASKRSILISSSFSNS